MATDLKEGRILDENGTSVLVERPDGKTDLITLSTRNQLLYKHGLWGVLERGDEVWVGESERGERRIVLTPQDDGYTLKVGDRDPVRLGVHHEGDLLDALTQYYGDGRHSADGLVNLFERLRQNQVRQNVLSVFVDKLGEYVEETADGWLVHDHLLITWEADFRHPGTTSHRVSGGGVRPGSNQDAYKMAYRSNSSSDPDPDPIEVDGETKELTDKEMRFLGKAVWAIENAPRGLA